MRLPILFAGPPGARAAAVADLLARDHDVLRAADLAVAAEACRRESPAAVVLPFPAASGEKELLDFLRAFGRRTAAFVYAGAGAPAPEAAARLAAAGARRLLDAAAPDFGDDLLRRLLRLVGDLRLRRHEKQARAQLFARYGLSGASPAMHDVFRRAIKASQFLDLPVLIEGEPGTPRRRLAAAILNLSRGRVPLPFFSLNCADLPRALVNRGGETERVAGRWRDLLRVARGGTVFLDDLDRLPLPLQRQLLTLLRQPAAEVRLLAATARPAAELVRAGLLDAELIAWLGLFRIPLPPLRGRPEDVAAQAGHFLRATPVTDFGPGVLERLQHLPWEGNTRQLEAVLRQALGDKRGGTALLLENLPPWVGAVEPDGPLPAPVPHPGDCVSAGPEDEAYPIDQVAEEYERRLMLRLLCREEGSGLRPDVVV